MLDEPSAGLSPVLVDRVLEVVSRLRAGGTAVLLVEQLMEKALAVSDRVYALAQGQVVLAASAKENDLHHRLERAYFGQDRASEDRAAGRASAIAGHGNGHVGKIGRPAPRARSKPPLSLRLFVRRR